MDKTNDLDDLIAENVREFEQQEVRRHQLSAAEREKMLAQTLGAKTQPKPDEAFSVGDPSAGITSKSVWYQFSRIQFASIVSIAVGEVRRGELVEYCVDINCTIHRSYRINLTTIPQTDSFLTALSQFMTFKVVPTVEEEMREQRRAEELASMQEADASVRRRRMEFFAHQQNELLKDLIQVECAPRISFGVIY